MTTKFGGTPKTSQIPIVHTYNALSNKRPSSQAPKDVRYSGLNQPAPKQYFQEQQEGQQYIAPASGLSYDPFKYQSPHSAQKAQYPRGDQVQSNSHSLGRDLQGMGLITQVKKGEHNPSVLPNGLQQVTPNSPTKQQQLSADQGGLRFDQEQSNLPLLMPQRPEVKGRKTLVLDLDETLVHSSFRAPGGREPPADIVLPVDIEGRVCQVYVLVRPGCLKFLDEMSKYYEVVIFTASLQKYADPLMDIIDPRKIAPQRLFREHCTYHEQCQVFVKDMAKIGRNLSDVIIIDNSPLSFGFQPENGMPILSWYDDRTDTKLIELIPVLKLLSEVPDVRYVLRACCSRDNVYQTDKSIVLCTRIIEDQKRIKKDEALRREQSIEQDQGKQVESTQSTSTQQITNARDEKPPIQPKVNSWVIGPTLNSELKSIIHQTQQTPIPRQKRNNPDPNLSGSSSLNYQKAQISLTQSNSKQNLLNTSQSKSTHGTALSYLHKAAATFDDQKSIRNLTHQTMIHSSTQDENSTIAKKQVALSKKRPKTASRDPGQTSFAKFQLSKNVSPIKTQSSALKKTQLSVTQKQMVFPQSATPQQRSRSTYHGQKSSTEKQNVRSYTGVSTSVQKAARPVTTQNSTRNSQERLKMNQDRTSLAERLSLSKSKAPSIRKKPSTIDENDLVTIGNDTSQVDAKQNQHETSSTKKQSYHSLRSGSTSNNHLAIETPPTKASVGNLISRLVTYTASQTPTSLQYSSTKKTTKASSSGKRMTSLSPAMRESSVTGGKSPGKIFTQTSSQQGVSLSNQGYSNLMKNLAPQFKNMHTPSKSSNVTTSIPKNQIIGGNVKGVKLISNANSAAITAAGGNSYLAAKFNQTLTSLGSLSYQTNQALLSKVLTNETASSSKHGSGGDTDLQISSMLNDFEKTKNLNKELLLMRNIGSPKQPSKS